MTEKYKHPPIEEALVEFRFGPEDEWDLTIPGKLHEHERIKQQYLGKPRTQKLVTASIPASADPNSNVSVEEGFRIQLVDESGRHMISLVPGGVLGINALKPYEGWEAFRPRVEAALSAYCDVAHPAGVSRIGVRYINKVVLPVPRIELDTYFKCRPPSTPELPSVIAGFMNRVEFVYNDGVKLLLTFATAVSPPEHSGFLLDFDIIWERANLLSFDKVMSVVDDLHSREGSAFEAIISDAAREVFNAD